MVRVTQRCMTLFSRAILVTAVCAILPGLSLAKKPPPAGPVSINSTSQNATDAPLAPVPQQSPLFGGNGYSVFAANDLGMHCGDLDTRLLSILPPFNNLHAQVIQKGVHPAILNDSQVQLSYSAAASAFDTVFSPANPQPPGFSVVGECDAYDNLLNKCTGTPPAFPAFLGVFKTNFWDDPIPGGSYDPFYPANITSGIPTDTGLIVPDTAFLPFLDISQSTMPGINGPYSQNTPQPFARFDTYLQFFVDFPFGYQLANMNWFAAEGIPLTTFDDAARVNPYPLMRVAAVSIGKKPQLLATVDTVAPISGEADCKNCHTSNDPSNGGLGAPTQPNSDSTVNPIGVGGAAVAIAFNDPLYGELPLNVSVEYAQDLNILRFHDRSNGDEYVDSAGNATECVDPANPSPPSSSMFMDSNPNCLTYKALNGNPVVCQTCHYTPALDLAQVGPLGGSALYADNGVADCPPNAAGIAKGGQSELCVANGRTQRVRPTMSRVIHRNAHSISSRFNAFNLPPPSDQEIRNMLVSADESTIVPPLVEATAGACVYDPATQSVGWPSNSFARLECTKCAADGKSVAECATESTCYQCHPGSFTKCLRGVMGASNIYCSDCHGTMAQVGNDFSGDMSIATPFPAGADLTKRVPWAHEPGCQSCHVGDAVNQPANTTGFIYAKEDGAPVPFLLLQAWTEFTYPDASTAAQPISAPNSRFAEDEAANGERILYRFSKGGAVTLPSGDTALRGHQGVACEMCHGSTHAEWPVTPDAPNSTWPPPNGAFAANDNVTAGQLQGHTGKIIECDTCHTGTYALNTALNGPHNIHPVGSKSGTNYSQWWVDNHQTYLGQNPTKATLNNKCGICHGTDGNGTILSEVAVTRAVKIPNGKKKTQTVTLDQGDAVSCGTCHVNPFGPPGPALVVTNP